MGNISFDSSELMPVIENVVDVMFQKLALSQDCQNSEKLVVSRKQAAEMLDISISTLDRLVLDKELKSIKLKGRVLFSTAELQRWVHLKESESAA